MKNTNKEIYYDNSLSKSPQIMALQQLGFEFIILGKQGKRPYAFFDTNVGNLSEYATYNGIALSVDLFPPFVTNKLEPDVFYKI